MKMKNGMHRIGPTTVRFWVWENDGWVKLTLKPDQDLTFQTSEDTDEGWEASTFTWRHDGDRVTLEWAMAGRDCDGLLERSGECECPIADLATQKVEGDHEGEDQFMPDWKEVDSRQRDHNAEKAGY